MPDAVAEVGHLLAVVEALDPRAAQELRGGLPRCDSTFGLGLAFFLAATANGARAWLGPKRCWTISTWRWRRATAAPPTAGSGG
ncbi:hypothetical protein [Azospirillum argentinense]